MKILFASAEVAPYAKTGGLGDVAGALPPALHRLGHEVCIAMPRYQSVRLRYPQHEVLGSFNVDYANQRVYGRLCVMEHQGVPLYLVDMPEAFERERIFGYGDDRWRFIVFTRGLLALLFHLNGQGWTADIAHVNDWHTALLPSYLKSEGSWAFGHTANVLTIHNLAYQGKTGQDAAWLARLPPDVEAQNFLPAQTFNFMARGIIDADLITTVSPNYAREIQTPWYGEGLDPMLRYRQARLEGILNGIDTEYFNPARSVSIAAHYNADDLAGKALCKAELEQLCGFAPEPERPIMAMVTRLVDQKGLDLVQAVLPATLDLTDLRFVLLGTGDAQLEQYFRQLAAQRPDRVAAFLRFDARLADQIYAGSDMFLMPSRFEPGGLGQLIAMRFGSVPIVRATGGLHDTVHEGYEGNGFVFWEYNAGHLYQAIGRAMSAYRYQDGWRQVMQRGMRGDYSWARSAHMYEAAYERALLYRRGHY